MSVSIRISTAIARSNLPETQAGQRQEGGDPLFSFLRTEKMCRLYFKFS